MIKIIFQIDSFLIPNSVKRKEKKKTLGMKMRAVP